MERGVISRTLIGERDGWLCHVCGRRVDRRLRYPNPESATNDHITLLAHGGRNSYDNVKLAHLRCNVSRGWRRPDAGTASKEPGHAPAT